MSVLTVVFLDRGATARERGSISFGRSTAASLKLDLQRADSALSRVTGVFEAEQGIWHLVNTASRATFRVLVEGGFDAALAPGSAPLALPSPSAGSIQVQTATSYVIDFGVVGDPVLMRLPEPNGETTTIAVADQIGLTDRERQVLALLGGNRLRDPEAGAWNIPSTSELQELLSLTSKQIENTINSLTTKFAPYVTGLIGSNTGRATTRRHQIVDFAIRSGCITVGDLNPDNSATSDKG